VIGGFEIILAPSHVVNISVLLLQIHWPGFPFLNNWATNDFVEGLGRAQKAGLTKAVGVSNFKAVRVREANKILQA
jgi:diketogulonate reductase-like aldo/keto reductase